jgi:hypothetical protein
MSLLEWTIIRWQINLLLNLKMDSRYLALKGVPTLRRLAQLLILTVLGVRLLPKRDQALQVATPCNNKWKYLGPPLIYQSTKMFKMSWLHRWATLKTVLVVMYLEGLECQLESLKGLSQILLRALLIRKRQKRDMCLKTMLLPSKTSSVPWWVTHKTLQVSIKFCKTQWISNPSRVSSRHPFNTGKICPPWTPRDSGNLDRKTAVTPQSLWPSRLTQPNSNSSSLSTRINRTSSSPQAVRILSPATNT